MQYISPLKQAVDIATDMMIARYGTLTNFKNKLTIEQQEKKREKKKKRREEKEIEEERIRAIREHTLISRGCEGR